MASKALAVVFTVLLISSVPLSLFTPAGASAPDPPPERRTVTGTPTPAPPQPHILDSLHPSLALDSDSNHLIDQAMGRSNAYGCNPPSDLDFDTNDGYANSWIKYHVASSGFLIDWLYVYDGENQQNTIVIDATYTVNSAPGDYCLESGQFLASTALQAKPGKYHLEIYFGGDHQNYRSGTEQCAHTDNNCNYKFTIWPRIMAGGTYKTSPGDGVTSFRTTTSKAYVYTDFVTTAAHFDHTIFYNWTRPDGTWFLGPNKTLAKGQSSVELTDSLDISGTPANQQTGTWWVSAWIDGTNYFHNAEYSFVILGPSAPNQAYLPQPADTQKNVPNPAHLSWSDNDPDGDALTYDVYLDKGANPTTKICHGLDTSCDTAQLAGNAKYFWRVDASDGTSTTQGQVWSFVTHNTAPNPPSAPVPGNTSTGAERDLVGRWAGGDAELDRVTYKVYFGTTNPPSHLQCSVTNVTSCDFGRLTWLQTYYWYVVASDGSDSTTGPLWSFTVKANPPPNPPANPTPANNTVNVSRLQTLTWQGGDSDDDDVVNYTVYLGASNPPTNLVCTTTLMSCSIGEVSWGDKYYWRVNASDGVTTVVSGVWSFTVVGAPDPEDAFFGGFEAGEKNWTLFNDNPLAKNLWHLAAVNDSNYSKPFDGNASMWFGDESKGTYDEGLSIPGGSIVSPIISLANVPRATLAFQSWNDTESDTSKDTKQVFASSNGGPWSVLPIVTVNGAQDTWVQYFGNLTSYAGANLSLKFTFNAVDNQRNNYKGWYIDNVRVFRDDDFDDLSYADEMALGTDPSKADTDADGVGDLLDTRPTINDNPPTCPNCPSGDPTLNITFDHDRGIVKFDLMPLGGTNAVEGAEASVNFTGTNATGNLNATVKVDLDEQLDTQHWAAKVPLPQNFNGGSATTENVSITLKDTNGNQNTYVRNFTDHLTFIRQWTNSSDGNFEPTLQYFTVNQAPDAPASPNPANGATTVYSSGDCQSCFNLTWAGGDADSDPVKYVVYFGQDNPPSTQTCGGMDHYCHAPYYADTPMYWQVFASDKYSTTAGPIWTFTATACQGCHGPSPAPVQVPGWQEESVRELPLPPLSPGALILVGQVSNATKYTFELPSHALTSDRLRPDIVPSDLSQRDLLARIAGGPSHLFEMRLMSVGPGTTDDGGLLSKIWDGISNAASVAINHPEVQSFIYGSDVNGHIAGDIVAGLLVYGNVRDVAYGAYKGNSAQVGLGIIGLALTFQPEADGPFQATKALIKAVKSPLARKVLMDELWYLVSDVLINRPGDFIPEVRQLGTLATALIPDAVKGDEIAAMDAAYPGVHAVEQLKTTEDIEAVSTAEKRWGSTVWNPFTAAGSSIPTADSMRTAAEAEGQFGNDLVKKIGSFAQTQGIAKVMNNLDSSLGKENAKGWVYPILKADARRIAGEVVEGFEVPVRITYTPYGENALKTVTWDVDLKTSVNGVPIWRELKSGKSELETGVDIKNQVLKLRATIDQWGGSGEVVVKSGAADSDISSFARSHNIDLVDDSGKVINPT